MSTLTLNPNVTVEPPVYLPVDYLSLSSIKAFMKCPEAWRRRYLEKLYEPPSGRMVLGGAAGAALNQHFGYQLETGQGITAEALLDEFSSEFDDRVASEAEVAWRSESPGPLKDAGAGALGVYHSQIAPTIAPVSIEREFRLTWPGVEWQLTGYLDLEDTGGAVRDYKMRDKRMSARDADSDLQVDVYLAARRAEQNPAVGFSFETMVTNKTPLAESVPSTRSDAQLDRLTERIFAIAREIEWRCETGIWSGASVHTWFCSTCRYADCPLRLGRI